MHNILREYQPGVYGYGFKALAKKYNVRGGRRLLSEWFKKWDGTESSLRKQSGGDKSSILTPKEKKTHILDFATKKSKVEAVNYPEVKENVEKKTGKDVSLRSVQRHGKELNLSSKKRKRVLKSQGLTETFFAFFSFLWKNRFFCVIGTEDYRESVVNIRKKCQNVNKNRLVFIDGSGIRAEARPLKGLAPRGQTPHSTTNKAEKYEPRVDIMGAISWNGPLACETKTSKQRKKIRNLRTRKLGVKGYTKPMVKDFLRNQLAPKIEDMKAKEVIVCMDKGLAFKEEEAKEAFRHGGTNKVKDIWILPTNTAKYVSPLDNNLWHSLKERVRARKTKTEVGTAKIVKDEFMSINETDIHNYYRNCKLTRGSNPNEDLDN